MDTSKKEEISHSTTEELSLITTASSDQPTPCDQYRISVQETIQNIASEAIELRSDGRLYEASTLTNKRINDLIETIVIDINTTAKLSMANYFSQWIEKEIMLSETIMANLKRCMLETTLSIHYDPAFITDSNGIYIACNDKFLNILKKKKEDIIGKRVSEITPRLEEFLNQERTDGELFSTKVICKNGSPHKVTIKSDVGFNTVVIHDLSKSIEFEEKSADIFGEAAVAQALLNGFSHNGRTSILQIRAANQLIKEGNTEKPWGDIIDENLQILENIMKLVSDTEVKNISLSITTFSPRKLLLETIDELKLSKKKEVRFDLSVQKKLPETITTDKSKLKEILQHLLRSALSFAKEDEITIQANRTINGEAQFTLEYQGIKPAIAAQKIIFAGTHEAGEKEKPKFCHKTAENLAIAIGGIVKIRVKKGKGKKPDTFLLDLRIPTEIYPPETEEQLIKQIPSGLQIIIENGDTTSIMLKKVFIKKNLGTRDCKIVNGISDQSNTITLNNGDIPMIPILLQSEEDRNTLWKLIIKKAREAKTEI